MTNLLNQMNDKVCFVCSSVVSHPARDYFSPKESSTADTHIWDRGSLSCYTCCNTWPWFSWSHWKDHNSIVFYDKRGVLRTSNPDSLEMTFNLKIPTLLWIRFLISKWLKCKCSSVYQISRQYITLFLKVRGTLIRN